MYNGYDNLTHFYTEMCALPPGNTTHNHIAIPHLVLQAFDDPISTWRSIAANDPSDPLHPWTLVNQNQENVLLLLTETGGHVGWPMGWWPNSWKYMNDYVATGFVSAYQHMNRSIAAANHQPSSTVMNETSATGKKTQTSANTSTHELLQCEEPLAVGETTV
jgi:hypothetical protein